MKDILTRTAVILIGGSFLTYLGYLFMHNEMIVLGNYASYNLLAYSFLGFIILGITVIFGVYPLEVIWTKRTTTAIGVIFLFGGYYFLVNDSSKMIYISDLVRVFGVLLIILGPLGYLIPDTIKKSKQAKKVQIIEV